VKSSPLKPAPAFPRPHHDEPALLGGTDGIVHVLRTILAEADLLMAVGGYPTLADLSRDAIRRT
jgi:isopentenyl diphosphate isomerase/L-lactate dehydrogenase-like FMN-dependent dehydrogenase